MTVNLVAIYVILKDHPNLTDFLLSRIHMLVDKYLRYLFKMFFGFVGVGINRLILCGLPIPIINPNNKRIFGPEWSRYT